MKHFFARNLLKWSREKNDRKMPWKGEKDPYKIWLSEIILQQTRVEQGMPYYNKFVSAYPTINKLAEADDEDVFKLWEGLGYYSRCKNLLFSARYISHDLNGFFPDSYEGLLKLKGVGPYTAAAIASFAYDLPHAVTDGNVFRVLSRYFGNAEPIDSAKGKLYFSDLASKLLDKRNSAAFNQAIMDFGASVCKPKIPKCGTCVFKSTCTAFRTGLVNKLPVKEKKLKRSTRWFYYFIFLCKDIFLVNRREEKDIWHGLYEFYLFESDKEERWTNEQLHKWMNEQLDVHNLTILSISSKYIQKLTHQDIKGQFISVQLSTVPPSLSQLRQVKVDDINKLAFPKFINSYFIEMPKPSFSLNPIAGI